MMIKPEGSPFGTAEPARVSCSHVFRDSNSCARCGMTITEVKADRRGSSLVAQRAVSDGEIIMLAWEAEDRVRCGASCLEPGALQALIQGEGLSLVTATDRAVLEAMSALDEMTPDFWADNTDDILLVRLGKAELARRKP